MSKLMLFAGNASQDLCQKIAQHLDLAMGRAVVGKFSDGEIAIEIKDNVRGKNVCVVQSTCFPTNDHLMELMILVDALRRSSAKLITSVVPYYGYSRQDRRPRYSRVAISARVVANMLSCVRIDRLLTVDLHADQIQGFFDVPVDNIYASPLFLKDIEDKALPNTIVVAPDHGGVVRARAIAKRLDCDLAIVDKRRPSANQAIVMNVIGCVKNKNCVLIDDMVDTAGTLKEAAKALKNEGAKSVCAYCTHPILSGNALQNIESSCLDELVVSNTIPLTLEAQKIKKIRQLDMSVLLAESINRVHSDKSVSEIFDQ